MYVFINYCRMSVERTMEITEMERRRKREDKELRERGDFQTLVWWKGTPSVCDDITVKIMFFQ